jgi:hypothetical protein
MDNSLLRAWWWKQQGLDGSLQGKSAGEVLERSGWARSVGGVGPYLTLFARNGMSREAADAAVAKLDIHELPSARGCTYVLPSSDFALGLKVGHGFGDAGDLKVAYKLGVTDKEIDKLCDAVLKALSKGPLDPAELREATGSASRSLGEEGKKKGVTTTMPIALGKLQASGDIRRIPINGRLDQQRYRYTLWRPNPLSKFKISQEEAYTELARRFFRWAGPATLRDFQGFSGLGVKVSQAALEPLKLVSLEKDSDRLMFPADRESLAKLKPGKDPQYALVSGLDAMFLLRQNVVDSLDSKDASRKVFGEKGLETLGSFSYLPSHAILDRGRLVGLWEFDPDGKSMAWTSFIKRDKQLEAVVKKTEAYVVEQLGDARSFSLDSAKSRAPRIKALRAAM